MAKRIEVLNSRWNSGALSADEYAAKARALLKGLDWQARIQWANKLYISV